MVGRQMDGAIQKAKRRKTLDAGKRSTPNWPNAKPLLNGSKATRVIPAMSGPMRLPMKLRDHRAWGASRSPQRVSTLAMRAACSAALEAGSDDVPQITAWGLLPLDEPDPRLAGASGRTRGWPLLDYIHEMNPIKPTWATRPRPQKTKNPGQ